MTNPTHSGLNTAETDTWELNALTEALGDLTVTVSESLSVGRGSDNDVVLGSKQVSRNHAVLSVLDGQLYVKDLDSSNGTFINNERIEGNQSSLLQVEDTIGFASFNFQVNKSVTDTGTGIEPVTPVVAEDTTAITDTEEPVAAQSMVRERVIPERTVQEPAVEKPVEESVVEEPIIEEPVVQEPAVEEPTVEEPIEKPVAEEPIIEAPVAEEPVMKKTDIEEMLPNKDDTAIRTEAPATAVKESAVHEEPVVQPEHDKTTRTELQEEADPEVLRAKQAATAQFSGTANLGQSRDLGTQGNNAMDQAIENPAATGQAEKKPSGSWFIWVFVALIIIGIALWLFNMGGTGAGA